jgi:hypothetical protein
MRRHTIRLLLYKKQDIINYTEGGDDAYEY